MMNALVNDGCFGAAVTAFVTPTKLNCVQPGLALGLVTTFSGSTTPVFIQTTQAHSAWPALPG